jgi:hypothetical protein
LNAAEPMVARCPNHPDVFAGLSPCARCGESYCASCLIQLRGRPVCASCKDEEVRDLRSGVVAGTAEMPWFSVSPVKFAAMTFCTLGFYALYWTYQQWKLVRDRQSEPVSPWGRTIFAIFYVHGLLKRIRNSAQANGVTANYSPGLFATLYIVGNLTWRLPGLLSMLGIVADMALLPAVRAIEEMRQANSPTSSPNAHFTGWNIAGLVFGGILLIMAIIGNLTGPA